MPDYNISLKQVSFKAFNFMYVILFFKYSYHFLDPLELYVKLRIYYTGSNLMQSTIIFDKSLIHVVKPTLHVKNIKYF